MAGRDDGEAWVNEEIRLPDDRSTPADGAWPDRLGGPDTSLTEIRSLRARETDRRRRRQTLTFLVSFGAIVLIGLLALAAYFSRIDLPFGTGRPEPTPVCPSSSPTTQAAGETSVNVFNASNRNGLALNVARELQKRGFLVPNTPANDRQQTKVTGMAVIRHGPQGLLAARTVAAVVAGEVQLVPVERVGTEVDLVLGQSFELKKQAAPGASPSAPSPTPTCVPAS